MQIPFIPKISITDLLEKEESVAAQNLRERFYAICPCCGSYIGLTVNRGYTQRKSFDNLDDCIQWLCQ